MSRRWLGRIRQLIEVEAEANAVVWDTGRAAVEMGSEVSKWFLFGLHVGVNSTLGWFWGGLLSTARCSCEDEVYFLSRLRGPDSLSRAISCFY